MEVELCETLESKSREASLRGGTISIPKNRDSDSLAHFVEIGTGIGIKGIVKRIEKESFFDSQFLITRAQWSGSSKQVSTCRRRCRQGMAAVARRPVEL